MNQGEQNSSGKRNKNIVRAVVIYSVFLIVSFVALILMRSANNQRSRAFLVDATRQRGDAVMRQIQSDLEILHGIAVLMSEIDLSDTEHVVELLDVVNHGNTFVRMGLAGADGRVDLVNLEGETQRDVDLSNQLFFKQALSGQEAVSQTLYDEHTGQQMNYYAVPVFQGGGVTHVMVGVNSEDKLRRVLQQPVLQGVGLASVIDNEGVFVVPGSEEYPGMQLGASVLETFGLASAERTAVEKMLAGHGAGSYSFQINGERFLTTWEPMDVNDWTMVTVAPQKELNGFFNVIALGTIAVVAAASLVFILLLRLQMKEMRKSQDELVRIAYVDMLTGGRNRTKMVQDAEQILRDNPGQKFAVWATDIKKFNTINDMFGKDTADAVLCRVDDQITEMEPENAIHCRIAADQFAGLRPYQHKEELLQWFDALFNELAHNRRIIQEDLIRLDMAMGFFCVEDFPQRPEVDEMVNQAAIAKKAAKQRAGTHSEFFSENMSDALHMEAGMEASGLAALENGDITFHLQPKVSIKDGYHVAAAEALARWTHPEIGRISPAVFIPLFERNGAVVDLDRYIFTEVCRWMVDSEERGITPVPVSINVSRQGLMREDTVSFYASVKEEFGIPEGMLELEFTESLAADDFETFNATVTQLQQRGFTCSIDDFGSGYSSLNVLKNLNIDMLKLDAAFFRGADNEKRGEVVVDGFIDMAHALGIDTVAEGVEHKEQVSFLRSARCDLIQGYVFSRPLPREEFEELLRRPGAEMYLDD